MAPRISVIIPVYNAAPYLRRCLDSVLGQTHSELEVLAVDDGSTDQSGAILREYAAKDPRLRVFYQPNSGQSAARNRALDSATGEWISFVDSDDICAPDMLETLLTRGVGAGADACWGGHILHNIPCGTACRRVPREGVYPGGEPLLSLYYTDPQGPAYVWAALYRREIFDGLRFPEGRIYEDLWMIPRIVDRAKCAVCVGEAVYHYCLYSTGTVNGSAVRKQMDLLWAQGENVAFTRERHPEWAGCAERKLLECSAELLGKIDRAGRRENRDCWDRAIAVFEESRQHLTGTGLRHRGAIGLFRVSPVLFAKCCRLYAFLHFRLPVPGTWREDANAI